MTVTGSETLDDSARRLTWGPCTFCRSLENLRWQCSGGCGRIFCFVCRWRAETPGGDSFFMDGTCKDCKAEKALTDV